ncbi:MAG: DUF2782 domain-containing protein [Sulfuriferula sp.]|nr:DUF2782 domain-containing protein [Sulfuriferula sp.]
MRKLIIATLFALPLTSLAADRPTNLEALPAVPPPPGLSNNIIEPEITTKQKSDGKYEEYRQNGRLYMIKVTPKTGKPYYLVDDKGDGKFSRQEGLDDGVRPPMWIIHQW